MRKTDIDLLDRVTLSGSEKKLSSKSKNEDVLDRLEVVSNYVRKLDVCYSAFKQTCIDHGGLEPASTLDLFIELIPSDTSPPEFNQSDLESSMVTLSDGQVYSVEVVIWAWLLIQIDAIVLAIVERKSLSLILRLNDQINQLTTNVVTKARFLIAEGKQRLLAFEQGSAGAKKKHKNSLVMQDKPKVYECWIDWQKKPTRYRSKAEFARDMISKYAGITIQNTVEVWCREWEKAAASKNGVA